MAQTSSRGFASMDPDKQKEIARKGGRAAHAKGTAHEFTPDEARAAGRKGGEVVSRNREHMATIGRRGGERRGQKRATGGDGRQAQPAGQTESAAGTETARALPRPDRGDRELEIYREREHQR
ncbi:MAG: KGG domain-containing protein [Thermoanaerobaculia bacterium]